MEDVIEKDPMAAYPPGHEDLPRITGDKLIDSWERKLAAGDTPDIAADFADDAAIQAWLKPKAKKPDGGGTPPSVVLTHPKPPPKSGVPNDPPEFNLDELDFHDDFTGG